MTSPGLVALCFALCFGGGGCKGLDGGNNFVNWEPEAEIGGSKSAGRAIPGWTDLECLLGLLPYIV